MTTNNEMITVPVKLFKRMLDGVGQAGSHARTVSLYAERLDDLTSGNGYFHEIREYEEESQRLWKLYAEAEAYVK